MMIIIVLIFISRIRFMLFALSIIISVEIFVGETSGDSYARWRGKYPSQGINGAKNIQPDAEGLNWNFAPGIFPGGTEAEIKI